MEYPHHFEKNETYSRLCRRCGREKNNYGYHFPPVAETVSGQEGIRAAEHENKERAKLHHAYGHAPAPVPLSDHNRIAQLERQVKTLTRFVELLTGTTYGRMCADRFREEIAQ